MLYLNIYCI